jgi:hypothetical protein
LKRLTILGATGSVGSSTLDLVGRNPDRFQVAGMAAGRDWARLAELARSFRPARVVIADEAGYAPLKDALADRPGRQPWSRSRARRQTWLWRPSSARRACRPRWPHLKRGFRSRWPTRRRLSVPAG